MISWPSCATTYRSEKKGIEQNGEITRLSETASDWQKKCLVERQERSTERLSRDHSSKAQETERQQLLLQIDRLDGNKVRMEAILDQGAEAQKLLEKELQEMRDQAAKHEQARDELEARVASVNEEIQRLSLLPAVGSGLYTEQAVQELIGQMFLGMI